MKYLALALVLTAALAPIHFLAAQEEEPTSATVQEEMRTLNATLKEIAALLGKHVAGQETDLLIKRVELANRTVISRREELARVKAEVARATEQERELLMTMERYEEGASKEELGDDTKRVLRFEMEQLEKRAKPLEARRKDLERRILELENDVMAHEENLRLLEDVLDERLGLR